MTISPPLYSWTTFLPSILINKESIIRKLTSRKKRIIDLRGGRPSAVRDISRRKVGNKRKEMVQECGMNDVSVFWVKKIDKACRITKSQKQSKHKSKSTKIPASLNWLCATVCTIINHKKISTSQSRNEPKTHVPRLKTNKGHPWPNSQAS